MTGYTVHTGTSKKYASGWDDIFKSKAKPQAKKTTAKKETAKKAASKSAKGKKKS